MHKILSIFLRIKKPPLYSPPTLGGDKKLNIIELTPPSSEGGGRGEVGRGRGNAPMFEDNGALTRSKESKPPLYSPPTLGGDKKLNIIELTPPSSEGGGRGEVGRGSGNAPMFEINVTMVDAIALMFDFNDALFDTIAAMFCFIDALVGVIAALFEDNELLVEAIEPMFCFIDALVGIIDALVGVIAPMF